MKEGISIAITFIQGRIVFLKSLISTLPLVIPSKRSFSLPSEYPAKLQMWKSHSSGENCWWLPFS